MQELNNLGETLTSLVEQFKAEHEKHAKGNAAAGGRARKLIGEIKNICTPYRKTSIELDKARKEEAK